MYCCACACAAARVANYMYIIQLLLGVLLLSCVSQLLNLNMQRGCHRTPRAIRLIAEESYLSHERLIALPYSPPSLPSPFRRFRDYDACLRWIYISETVSVICAHYRTMHDGWMDVAPAPSLKLFSPPISFVWYTIHRYMCVLLMFCFFPDCVCWRVLAVSRAFSRCSPLFIEICIHTKKWIKAPNFLA